MGGFYTHFHATIDELGDIIEAWLDQHPIFISAFAFPPCTRVAISRDPLREVLAREQQALDDLNNHCPQMPGTFWAGPATRWLGLGA